MLDHFVELATLLATAHGMPVRCAVATIVSTSGSAPRQPGTSMIVSESGGVTGSLSGGCLEGSVFEACLDAIGTGKSQGLVFGYEAGDPFAAGLTCGGVVEIFVQPFDSAEVPVLLAAPVSTPLTLIHALDTGQPSILPVDDQSAFTRTAAELAAFELLGKTSAETSAELFDAVANSKTRIIATETGRLFVESRPSRPTLFLFGANDFSSALAAGGRLLGYRIVLCDARPVFARQERFPDVDELAVEQPEPFLRERFRRGEVAANSVVCVLTHDPKFDVPVLAYALQLPCSYVGVLGSRKSQANLSKKLEDAGVDATDLAKLRGPIGLDIGAVTPAEVAVSVLAEIIASSHQRTVKALAGLSLTEARGPIHGTNPPAEDSSRTALWI